MACTPAIQRQRRPNAQHPRVFGYRNGEPIRARNLDLERSDRYLERTVRLYSPRGRKFHQTAGSVAAGSELEQMVDGGRVVGTSVGWG